MTSIPAQEVAKEVIKSLGKSRKPVLRKIAVEKGYSQHTADTPKNITDTNSYKEIMNPVIEAFEKERQAIIERLPKVRNQAKYNHLVEGLDKLTKNIQLLNGGKTSNEGIQISWE